MGYGRLHKHQPTKGDWTEIKELSDGSKLFYGRIVGCYYYLCNCGAGQGFTDPSLMYQVINHHNHKEI